MIAAATPFNDIRVTIKFRKLNELLMFDYVAPSDFVAAPNTVNTVALIQPTSSAGFGTLATLGTLDVFSMTSTPPTSGTLFTSLSTAQLIDAQLYAHYALISTPDRAYITDETEIDQIIDQWQYVPSQPWSPSTMGSKDVELRVASTVRAIMWGVRNTTYASEWSNYSSHHTEPLTNGLIHPFVLFQPHNAQDPVKRCTLRYEVSERWVCDSDYCSYIAPYYFCESIPTDIGLHVISYAVHLSTTGPYGSSNFGRLTSVVMTLEASNAAKMNNNALQAERQGNQTMNTYVIHILASALNLWRSAGGAAGYPLN